MKYWATDNLKQERFVSNVEKSLTREDIKRRETRQRKRRTKKKVSSKEISREVSTHKIMDYRARTLRKIFKRLQEMGELGQS